MVELVGFTDEGCYDNLLMNRATFARLCYLLQVPKQVVFFLTSPTHHTKLRVVKFCFKRSAQTVSKYIHNVLNAIMRLHDMLLATPEPVDEDCNHPRWKWFKGCFGTLDGTYVDVTVRESEKPCYRTRKRNIAVNVLALCDQNMRFTYMLKGWEGLAADSCVLRDAVTRPNGFKVPKGNYFLCDNDTRMGKVFSHLISRLGIT